MKFVSFLIVLCSFGLAQAQNLVIPNVKVSVTASSAAEAREQAIENAHDQAFQKLIETNFPETQRALPPHETIVDMVSNFSIDKEKSTSTNYTALMSFEFDQSKLHAWLQNQNNPLSLQAANTVGVKPLKAKASYQNLAEWNRIKKTLESLPQIQGVELQSVSSNTAELRFLLNGNPEDLKTILAQKGLSFSPQNEEWIISCIY